MTDACTLTETVVEGDRCLQLQNAALRISINVDHGAHLFELTDLRTGTNLLYQDRRGSRHYLVGGWYELFPNAGAACIIGGRQLSAHGDIQHRRWTWSVREASSRTIELQLATASHDLPFRISKTITLTAESAAVQVAETITNISDSAHAYLWGQHITFGAPFVGPELQVEIPNVDLFARADIDASSAPYEPAARGPLARLPSGPGRTVDLTVFPSQPSTMMLFSVPLPEHRYRLHNNALDTGVEVTWDGSTFPVLWIWGTNQGTKRDPDVVALAVEPQSCAVPTLNSAITEGVAPVLPGRHSRSGWTRVEVFGSNSAHPGRTRSRSPGPARIVTQRGTR